MIGTMRLPIPGSRSSSLNTRTIAIVVATCWGPEPCLSASYTERCGSGSALAEFRRAGTNPPSAVRRSSR